MANADLIIQDLKVQISRLSEERAIYFSLASEKEDESNRLKQELGSVNQQLKIEKDKNKTLEQMLEDMNKPDAEEDQSAE